MAIVMELKRHDKQSYLCVATLWVNLEERTQNILNYYVEEKYKNNSEWSHTVTYAKELGTWSHLTCSE